MVGGEGLVEGRLMVCVCVCGGGSGSGSGDVSIFSLSRDDRAVLPWCLDGLENSLTWVLFLLFLFGSGLRSHFF